MTRGGTSPTTPVMAGCSSLNNQLLDILANHLRECEDNVPVSRHALLLYIEHLSLWCERKAYVYTIILTSVEYTERLFGYTCTVHAYMYTCIYMHEYCVYSVYNYAYIYVSNVHAVVVLF